MQSPFKSIRLPNFFKPTLIMLGTFAFIHLIGFFVQHDFSHHDPLVGFKNVNISAVNFLGLETKEETKVIPAPPETKVGSTIKILPSGEILP